MRSNRSWFSLFGLALLLAVAGRPAGADLIEVTVEDARYYEQVGRLTSGGPELTDVTTDPTVPGVASRVPGPATGPFTFTPDTRAGTFSRPPAAIANAGVSSAFTGGDPWEAWGAFGVIAEAYAFYQLAVVNWEGTSEARSVPLRVKGLIKVGTSGSRASGMFARGTVQVYEPWPNTPYETGKVLAQDWAEETRLGYEREKPFDLRISVPVGREPGSFYLAAVRLEAHAEIGVSAHYSRDHPEQNYCGSGEALAVVDPYIYIDPSWPYADEYGLVCSSNVQNVPEPASLILLAAGGLAVLLRRSRPGRRCGIRGWRR
jgi:hypothetical protein